MLSRHSYVMSAVRTAVLAPLFILGCVSIVLTQEVAKLVFANSASNLQAVINLSKKFFISLLTFIASVIYPTKLEITYDPAASGGAANAAAAAAGGSTTTTTPPLSFSANDGHLAATLAPNSVVISNHQIYTDWLSLWHILNSANLGGYIYIYLKDLSWIPILGRGMKTYNFLFLSRKWEKDKIVLTNQLLEIDANARGYGPANGVRRIYSSESASDGALPVNHWPKGINTALQHQQHHQKPSLSSQQLWPYEIILYPEGTVTSPHTRVRSEKYCREKGLPVLKHVLLPRVRGLFITLKKLRNTVEVVYDVTTGYSGLKPGENGEDIYTLKRFFLLGHGPKVIHHHVKCWRLKDIPLGGSPENRLEEEEEDIDLVAEEDLQRFEEWLFKVWFEKDILMDEFYQNGSFYNLERTPTLKRVNADMKVRNYFDVLSIFTPLAILLLLLRTVWVVVARALF